MSVIIITTYGKTREHNVCKEMVAGFVSLGFGMWVGDDRERLTMKCLVFKLKTLDFILNAKGGALTRIREGRCIELHLAKTDMLKI